MLTTTSQVDAVIKLNGHSHEPIAPETQMAALWVCDPCQVWWGSQNGRQREARFLLQLAEPNTPLFKWEDYRGWREKGTAAHVCPDCGREVTLPRFTLLSQAGRNEAQNRQ